MPEVFLTGLLPVSEQSMSQARVTDWAGLAVTVTVIVRGFLATPPVVQVAWFPLPVHEVSVLAFAAAALPATAPAVSRPVTARQAGRRENLFINGPFGLAPG